MGNSTGDAGIVLGRWTEKRIGVAIVACALSLGIFLTALPILAPAAGAQGSQQTVPIQDFSFSPAQITVEPGTTVTWVNQGNSPTHRHCRRWVVRLRDVEPGPILLAHVSEPGGGRVPLRDTSQPHEGQRHSQRGRRRRHYRRGQG